MKFFAASIAILLLPQFVDAGIVTYTNRTAFEADAATAGLSIATEDFSTSPANGLTISDGTNSATLQFEGGSSQGGLWRDFAFGLTNTNAFESTAVVGSIAGIAFDYQLLGGDTNEAVINLTTSDGNFMDSTNVRVGFFGALSTDGTTISSIDSVRGTTTVTTPFGTAVQVLFDDITIAGASATAVPEPSSIAMISLGMIGIAFRRRQRQRRES